MGAKKRIYQVIRAVLKQEQVSGNSSESPMCANRSDIEKTELTRTLRLKSESRQPVTKREKPLGHHSPLEKKRKDYYQDSFGTLEELFLRLKGREA